jgi:ATP/ADP translocase
MNIMLNYVINIIRREKIISYFIIIFEGIFYLFSSLYQMCILFRSERIHRKESNFPQKIKELER